MLGLGHSLPMRIGHCMAPYLQTDTIRRDSNGNRRLRNMANATRGELTMVAAHASRTIPLPRRHPLDRGDASRCKRRKASKRASSEESYCEGGRTIQSEIKEKTNRDESNEIFRFRYSVQLSPNEFRTLKNWPGQKANPNCWDCTIC